MTSRSFVCAAWVLGAQLHAGNLSPLAPPPDWTKLNAFQKTITHDEFVRRLDNIYAPHDAAVDVIKVSSASALITTTSGTLTLHFAATTTASPPRYWQPAAAQKRSARPLQNISIALDPGHLGGSWAKMEERWFQIGAESKPVVEGEMALIVAQHLASRLQTLGANVTLVRNKAGPVTKLRPADLHDEALQELKKRGVKIIRETYDGAEDQFKENSIQWMSELLFYRVAEIRRRAQIVNQRLQPDLVLCLHFNAEVWGDPSHPTLVEKNHLHLLVNGSYSKNELAFDDERFEMLIKLLNGSSREELAVADEVANTLAKASGLPPYQYTNGNAFQAGGNPYVWARNLLANRLYQCPVVYIEPYVMNSQSVWNRVQLGDYEDERLVDGQKRKSIYREYADAVAEGLETYYRDNRRH